MNNINTVEEISEIVKNGEPYNLGRVRAVHDGKYVLLNYTNEAQYGNEPFTDIERACRGLVIRKEDGKVMALPMEKFFNLGEAQCPSLPEEDYTVWEKVDGSLGIFWCEYSNDPKVPSRWRCNTRGSFDNEYVDFALDWWYQHAGDMGIPGNYTVMVEICMDGDEMSRAAYKPEGLYLIAIRNRDTGEDVPITELNIDGLLPIKKEPRSIGEIIGVQDTEEQTEGWVIRFDSGFRVKVKTTWYLKLFKAIHLLNPSHIRDLMLDGTFDEILLSMPDDLQPRATEIKCNIECKLNSVLCNVYKAYDELKHIESRKEFALNVLRDYKGISKWLFLLKNNRFNERDVLQKLDLRESEERRK